MATTTRQSSGPSSQRPLDSYYTTPTFPLNPTAQRQLAHLVQAHQLKNLNDRFEAAQKQLTESAGDINDRLTRKTRYVQKSQNNSTGTGNDDGLAESEQSLEQMQSKVQSMTQRMDESLRKLIDGQHNVKHLLASIQGAANDARDNADTQASTQGLRSRRTRGTENIAAPDGEEESGDDEPQSFDPTDPASNHRPRAPLEVFRAGIEDAVTRYQSRYYRERYGENETYRDFKRVVHDALYPDDDVPLPHHSEWFQEGTVPAPGVSIPGANAGNHDDDDDDDNNDDDDIAVSRATISTKCPITLQELREPLTSRNCPHSFEKSAILEMIGTSSTRVPVPEGNRNQTQKAVQCPVPGCSQMIAKTDLHKDAVLMRKIGRIQRARQLQEEEEEDEENDTAAGTQRRTQVIEDEEDDGGADIDDLLVPEPSSNARKESRRTTTTSHEDEDVVMMSD